MRFFIAFSVSFFLHIAIVVYIFIFTNNFKPQIKPQTTTFHIESFSIEKPKVILKPYIQKEQTIEKPKQKEIKQVVETKKIKKNDTKSIVEKKVIPKEKEIVKKTLVKKEVAKSIEDKKIEKKVVIEKNAPSIDKEVTSKKENLLIKRAKKEKIVSDFEVQNFLSNIYHIIYQHKSYPQRAKKLHIEGAVTVYFTLFQDGTISEVKIMHSSGVKFLDDHTIKTIIEASNAFPQPPTKLEMKVPIEYYLR